MMNVQQEGGNKTNNQIFENDQRLNHFFASLDQKMANLEL